MFDSPIIFDYIGTSSNPIRPASTTTETKVRSPNGCWVEFGSDGVRNLIFDLYIFLFTPEQVRFAGRPFPDSISRPHACAWTFFVFRHGCLRGAKPTRRMARAARILHSRPSAAAAGRVGWREDGVVRMIPQISLKMAVSFPGRAGEHAPRV